MTWIDIIITIIIVGLIIHGIAIGLIRGAFDIAGIVLGYLLAISYAASIKIPKVIAFVLIFIGVFLVVSIIGRAVSKLIHITPLGFIDRILGGILGFLKGLVICFVFILVILLIKKDGIILHGSEIAPLIVSGGLKASQLLPQKWYNWIEDIVTQRKLVFENENHHISL